MIAWAMLAIFIVTFIAWVVFSINRRLSATEIVGGGFIAGTFLAALIGGGASVFLEYTAPLPTSLASAGLVNRPWSDSDLHLAGRITSAQVAKLVPIAEDAFTRRDEGVLYQVFVDSGETISVWSDHNSMADRQIYHFCTLALSTLMDMKNGGGSTAPLANLEHCKALSE